MTYQHKLSAHALFVFWGILVVSGCAVREEPARPFRGPVYISRGPETPVRLAPLVLNMRRNLESPPLTFQGDQIQPITMPGSGLRGWTIAAEGVSADAYNEVRLRLKIDRGSRGRIAWQGTFEPSFHDNPGVPLSLTPDGAWHDYTVTFGGIKSPEWRDEIKTLAIFLPEETTQAEIERVELTFVSPQGPSRLTLDNVTMEAVEGRDLAWELSVPAEAEFEAHVGLLSRAKAFGKTASVTFRVSARNEEGEAILAETSVEPDAEWTPQWRRLRADLRHYGGKTVTLRLEQFAGSGAAGHYGVWGNPLVYTKEKRAADLPVILISCDTLRADHLSCYGYARQTSPNLDAFSREAVLFENAVTPETWTLTAHVSMLTGLYPTRHGVNASTNLAESVRTLPEVLAEANYHTAGFTGYKIWMLPWRGLSHGFDVYSTPEVVRDIFATRALVDEWLEQHPSRRTFLFFHNYDLHSKYDQLDCPGCDLPYFPPNDSYLHFSRESAEPESLRAPGRPRASKLLFAALEGKEVLTAEEIAYLRDLYDDAIRGVDDALGSFFASLKDRGLYEDALLIVTADHGELFGEHGEFLHEHIYEGAARVPLLVRFPRGEFGGRRVQDMVQLLDIYPTVLEVLGLPVPETDGRSLLGIVRGDTSPAPLAFLRRQEHQGVRSNQWKYIYGVESGAKELYRLTADPAETRNLAAEIPAILPELEAERARFFSEDATGWHVAFHSSNPDWRGTLVLTTSDRFETVKCFFGGARSRNDLVTLDERAATITLGPLPTEHVLVRTDDPAASVLLSMASEREFEVRFAGIDNEHHRMRATSFQTTLDPAASATRNSDRASEVPSISIWYESETETGSAAPELTAEQREELEATGYAGDVKQDDRSGREQAQ